MDLIGGSVLWKAILYFWPIQEEKELIKENRPEIQTVLCHKIPSLKHGFFIENTSTTTEKPILIVYCGMGKTLIPLKLYLNDMANELKGDIHPRLFSVDHMVIDDIPKLVDESTALYDYVDKEYPNHSKLIIGHSLGSGIAAQVAKQKSNTKNLKGVLLVSGGSNLTLSVRPLSFLKKAVEMVAKYLLGTILDTKEALEHILVPVKIIHTQNDNIFSIKHIRPLKDIQCKQTQMYPMYEERPGKHGDAMGDLKTLKKDIIQLLTL
jgi:hypothetical protein